MGKTKEIAILLNSPYLGGAERSMVYQASRLPANHTVHFYVPTLGEEQSENEVSNFVRELGYKATLFKFGDNLFSWSRFEKGDKVNTVKKLINTILDLANLFIEMKKIGILQHPIVWSNGNKVGVPMFIFYFCYLFSGKFVWHFRDYPAERGIFAKVWKPFRRAPKDRIKLVGNSHSVSNALKEISFHRVEVCTVYDPVGQALELVKIGHRKTFQ